MRLILELGGEVCIQDILEKTRFADIASFIDGASLFIWVGRWSRAFQLLDKDKDVVLANSLVIFFLAKQVEVELKVARYNPLCRHFFLSHEISL